MKWAWQFRSRAFGGPSRKQARERHCGKAAKSWRDSA